MYSEKLKEINENFIVMIVSNQLGINKGKVDKDKFY